MASGVNYPAVFNELCSLDYNRNYVFMERFVLKKEGGGCNDYN